MNKKPTNNNDDGILLIIDMNVIAANINNTNCAFYDLMFALYDEHTEIINEKLNKLLTAINDIKDVTQQTMKRQKSI